MLANVSLAAAQETSFDASVVSLSSGRHFHIRFFASLGKNIFTFTPNRLWQERCLTPQHIAASQGLSTRLMSPSLPRINGKPEEVAEKIEQPTGKVQSPFKFCFSFTKLCASSHFLGFFFFNVLSRQRSLWKGYLIQCLWLKTNGRTT